MADSNKKYTSVLSDGTDEFTIKDAEAVKAVKVGSSGAAIPPTNGTVTIPTYEEGADVTDAENVKAALGTNSTHENKFLRKDGTWQTTPDTHHDGSVAADSGYALTKVQVSSNGTWSKEQVQIPSTSTLQSKITASGILKGDGNGGVTAATEGTDYQAPLSFKTTPSSSNKVVTESDIEDFTEGDGTYPDMTVGKSQNIFGSTETNDMFVYRPTAGIQDIQSGQPGLGGAEVQKIEGNGLAWNQLIQSDRMRSTLVENGITWNVNPDGTVTANGTATEISQFNIYEDSREAGFKGIEGHKYYSFLINGGSEYTYYGRIISNGGGIDNYYGESVINTCGDSTIGAGIILRVKGGITVTNLTFYPMLIDLTLIFGVGNEPSTVTEFETWLANNVGLKDYYPYCAGELIGVNTIKVKTTGFNQWDEEWEVGYYNTFNEIGDGTKQYTTGLIRSKNFIPVIGGMTYYIKTPIPSCLGFYDANYQYLGYYGGNKKDITFIVPTNAKYMVFYVDGTNITTYNHDICINLHHSGSRDGEYEPYWSEEKEVDVTTLTGKLNGAGNSVTVFPDGLKKVGSVCDEINTNAAIKRIGSRAYASGDESDSTVVTDGTNTWYVLATAEEYIIDNLDMPVEYSVDDYGTEELLLDNGTTITECAPKITIKYGINAADAIKNLPHNYVSVKAQALSSSEKAQVRANIGLGNVDNTADANKSVAYASVAGGVICHGTDVELKTYSSSDDSGDVTFYYGNDQEKARIWTDNEYTSSTTNKNLNFRLFDKQGNSLYNGFLATKADIPASLPANGGNSSTVNGHTVNSDVPANAVFTDTNTWRPLGTGSTDACAGNDSRLSDSRPASDVYSWAKASTKPSYTASEVGISSSVQAITSNKSSSCSITGSSNDGKSQTIIYTNSTSSDLTVTVPTDYTTPDGQAIELTCKAGGYCEVNYLNIGGTIYARGL